MFSTYRVLVFSIAAAGGALHMSSPGSAYEMARGVVYHDVNRNREFDEGDQPLSGQRVSNGREIAVTNAAGRYELTVDDDDILFVIKPRGWRAPLSEDMLPRFFYIHKPNGSPPSAFEGVPPTGPLPESVDFPLYPQREPDQFKALMFGDPQPRNQKEVDYIAHDVVEELIGTDASFGVTLGDIAFDDLSTFQPLNRAIALIGIPWYNVIGNHDLNFEAKHDQQSDETFERVYGPSYYSFDYGPVHFIVLDDVEWFIPDGSGGRGSYRGGIGEEQLKFIQRDLQLIPEEQLVVLMMHIPLSGVEDRHDLYRLIEQRPFCMSISAHYHRHFHQFIGGEDGWQGPKRHHHVVNVTVSGSWWSGAPDERGIPHTLMSDGAPNGYSIFSFDGTDYELTFKAAARPADYQMEIFAPEEVKQQELSETDILVNVFNGSERSTVQMRLGDHAPWITLQLTSDEVSPNYQAVSDFEAALDSDSFRELPDPRPSSHLWRGRLSGAAERGTHLLQVRTIDLHGREFSDQRTVRVK